MKLLLAVLALVLPAMFVAWLIVRAAQSEPETRVTTVETVPVGLFDELFETPPTTTTTVRRPAPVVRQRNATRTTAPIERNFPPPSERWLALADCESGDGDGLPPYSYDDDYQGVHDGALQWAASTWSRARALFLRLVGREVAATANVAPFDDEVAVAKVWLAATSPRQWPTCGPKVGLTMADAA